MACISGAIPIPAPNWDKHQRLQNRLPMAFLQISVPGFVAIFRPLIFHQTKSTLRSHFWLRSSISDFLIVLLSRPDCEVPTDFGTIFLKLFMFNAQMWPQR